jgi:hypothetical protein
MRWLLPLLLLIGMPAWFVYWITYSNLLIVLYMTLGYIIICIIATWWADKCLPWVNYDLE